LQGKGVIEAWRDVKFVDKRGREPEVNQGRETNQKNKEGDEFITPPEFGDRNVFLDFWFSLKVAHFVWEMSWF
jgi:hypothetical protein